jgi:Carbohydrate-binding module 48 (Isoamylase N-terminal domain)
MNIALFSARATKVDLCLFDDAGDRESARIDLPEYTDKVWLGFLPVRDRERSTAIACTGAMPPLEQGYRICGLAQSFSAVIPAKAGIHWADTTLCEAWTPPSRG